MRSSLNIDDFDNYLEEEVNQHRMYPSDHVWRNIQQELHGYKKWPALTVITLFVISALVVGTLLMKPNKLAINLATTTTTKTTVEAAEKNTAPPENLQQHLSSEHITQQTIAAVAASKDIDDALQNAFAAYHNAPELPLADNVKVEATPVIAVVANVTNADANAVQQKANAANNAIISGSKTDALAKLPLAAKASPTQNNGNKVWERNANALNWMKVGYFDSNVPNRFYYSKGVWKTVYGSILFSSARELHSKGSYEFYNINASGNSLNKITQSKFRLEPKASRLDLQLYAAPSIAYRTVSYGKANPNKQLSGIPYGAGYVVNMDGIVTKKSVTGYEAGASLGYKLSNNFTLRAGLQFNERQYNIEGYIPNSAPINTIPISNNSPLSQPINASFQTNTQTVTTTGSTQPPVVFVNKYYQVSMPLGIDWKAWASGRFSLGVAAGLQPTYIFSKTPFIVTSDSKSYADGAKLMRKWNVNSNLEAYFAYTVGKFKWQIGPQVRYQLLSTLNSNYPVKEHLVDYGIKIGVTRSLP